eukprot:TRINITY_DN3099_c0_g2_i2.p1 TRINITY_DN3099_c0_g2~~TRINITY_DN3099_c0_g2_i2.p1  ORF type:complete len:414 (+),score=119.44 TRINITY_DN3099_c0_g2_i2:2-1243(+)
MLQFKQMSINEINLADDTTLPNALKMLAASFPKTVDVPMQDQILLDLADTMVARQSDASPEVIGGMFNVWSRILIPFQGPFMQDGHWIALQNLLQSVWNDNQTEQATLDDSFQCALSLIQSSNVPLDDSIFQWFLEQMSDVCVDVLVHSGDHSQSRNIDASNIIIALIKGNRFSSTLFPANLDHFAEMISLIASDIQQVQKCAYLLLSSNLDVWVSQAQLPSDQHSLEEIFQAEFSDHDHEHSGSSSSTMDASYTSKKAYEYPEFDSILHPNHRDILLDTSLFETILMDDEDIEDMVLHDSQLNQQRLALLSSFSLLLDLLQAAFMNMEFDTYCDLRNVVTSYASKEKPLSYFLACIVPFIPLLQSKKNIDFQTFDKDTILQTDVTSDGSLAKLAGVLVSLRFVFLFPEPKKP